MLQSNDSSKNQTWTVYAYQFRKGTSITKSCAKCLFHKIIKCRNFSATIGCTGTSTTNKNCESTTCACY